ncbi:MAG: DUF1254 domain-containing protein [Steroidobacteraceae bacterium]
MITPADKRPRWSWYRHLLLAALIAMALHIIAVLLIPRLVMTRVIDTVAGEGLRPFLPPPIDHTHRRVVMPSPDLLYAVCAYDLADGPLRITLKGSYARYWSIALYNSRSDNFLTMSSDDVGNNGVDLTIDETRSTQHGLLLMRVMTGTNPEWLSEAEAFRQTLRCEQQTGHEESGA